DTSIRSILSLNQTGCITHLVSKLLSIGACGTAYTNSAGFSKELKNRESFLKWNTLLDKIVNDVLAVLWINNGLVTMLSMIHEIFGEDCKAIRN
ncbi:7916_t:CDS:2, partial [Dentiscutata erythropus]